MLDQHELYERGLYPSWKVVVLDYDECKLFFDERLLFNDYKEEFFELGEFVEEWDDCEPQSHDEFSSISIPCPPNRDYIKFLKEELDPSRLESFNSETNFIQRLFTTYYVDHLILINDEIFSEWPITQRPEILAHEAFHIVEYELFEQNHKGEEINENAEKLVEQYIASLTDVQRKSELNKICSPKNGRGKYGRLRIITKLR